MKYAPDRVDDDGRKGEASRRATASKRKISNKPQIKNCETPEIIKLYIFQRVFLVDVLLSPCVVNWTIENYIFVY